MYLLNMLPVATNVTSRANETLTRTIFVSRGIHCELVTHKTGKGRVEVYREYEDGCGLTRFVDYYEDVCVSDPRVAELVHPMLARHQETHRAFWGAYLPGADTWLHAA